MAAALGRTREGRLAGRSPRLADPAPEPVSAPVVIPATAGPGVPPERVIHPASAPDVGELARGVRVGRAAAEPGSGSPANKILLREVTTLPPDTQMPYDDVR